MRDYQKYSIDAADCFDANPRWVRLITFIIDDLIKGKPIKGMYLRFVSFETYLSEQSLRRKLNKLRHMGLMDANYNSLQGD
jgi:hypothetical protein